MRIFTWATKATGTKTTLSPVKAPVLNEPLTVSLYNFVLRWSILRTLRFINALFIRRLPPLCSPWSTQPLICLFSPHCSLNLFLVWLLRGSVQNWTKMTTPFHARASTQLSVLECHSRRVLVARWVTLTNPVLSAASFYSCGLACASGRKWTRKCLGMGKGPVIKTIRVLGWRVSTPRPLWCSSHTSERKISARFLRHVSGGWTSHHLDERFTQSL